MTGEPSPTIPGWYGKLPSLGDFASRRLPAEFVRAWDAWLQEVLPATRHALGDTWLDCYLTTPIWRFVLLPGLLGPSAWAGVLMPSVDRVGRHFPLTLAVALPAYTGAAYAIFEGAGWFAGLEDTALGALDVTRGPEELDRALAESALTLPRLADLDGSVGALHPLASVDAFGRLAAAPALRAWGLSAGWNSLWWTRGRVDGGPLMLVSAGLPTAREFSALLQSYATRGAAGAGTRF